jgi:predicted RNase H-like HicB family nuclease
MGTAVRILREILQDGRPGTLILEELPAARRRRSASAGGPVRDASSRGRLMQREVAMRNEFTAVIERDGEWFVAYCPEIPGANGQGRSKDEALQSLTDAIALILEDRREDALRGLPPDALRETVTVG